MTSVTEAARELLGLVGAAGLCHTDPASGWHVLTGARHPELNCPACAIRRAIAADVAQQQAEDPRDATIRDLRALLERCATALDVFHDDVRRGYESEGEPLDLDVLIQTVDDVREPNNSIDWSVCLELLRVFAALRSAGMEPTP